MQGYDKIVRYLEQHWTEVEIRGFIQESDEFFKLYTNQESGSIFLST